MELIGSIVYVVGLYIVLPLVIFQRWSERVTRDEAEATRRRGRAKIWRELEERRSGRIDAG